MSKYKYRICQQDEFFWFELLPNNSNTQPVAKSSPYNSYNEAVKGVDTFKKYMDRNVKGTLDSEVIVTPENRFQFRIYFSPSRKEFLTARACEKYNLKEAERRIRENYLVFLRREL